MRVILHVFVQALVLVNLISCEVMTEGGLRSIELKEEGPLNEINNNYQDILNNKNNNTTDDSEIPLVTGGPGILGTIGYFDRDRDRQLSCINDSNDFTTILMDRVIENTYDYFGIRNCTTSTGQLDYTKLSANSVIAYHDLINAIEFGENINNANHQAAKTLNYGIWQKHGQIGIGYIKQENLSIPMAGKNLVASCLETTGQRSSDEWGSAYHYWIQQGQILTHYRYYPNYDKITVQETVSDSFFIMRNLENQTISFAPSEDLPLLLFQFSQTNANYVQINGQELLHSCMFADPSTVL